MNMFKRKTNSDLERLEGGKLMSLDRFMTLLCYLILVTVVILPVFMIIYYAFWDGTKIDSSTSSCRRKI